MTSAGGNLLGRNVYAVVQDRAAVLVPVLPLYSSRRPPRVLPPPVPVVVGEGREGEAAEGAGVFFGVHHPSRTSMQPCLSAFANPASSSTLSGTRKTSPHSPHSYPMKKSWFVPS